MMVRTLTLLIALALPWPALAQVVLTGGQVHTVSGKIHDPGVVVLGKDGKLQAVGPVGATKTPAGATLVDVSGKVITPGLIDANTSLGMVEIWAVGASNDTSNGKGLARAAFQTADSFNPGSAVLPVQREFGVTDVVIAPGGGLVAGQSAWAELADPRSYGRVVARSLAMYMSVAARGAVGGSRGNVLGALRELYEDVRYYAKNKSTFDQNRARKLTANRLDLAALGATLNRKMPVVMRADRASDILASLAFARAQGLAPIISGGTEAWRVAGDLARDKVPVLLEPTRNLPGSFDRLGARLDNAALLHKAGVPVILTTFESHNVRKLRQVAGNAVRSGLPHDVALRAVTLHVAQAFGQSKTRGSLEVGKVANVVVWSGDPFELSTRVESMYIQGRPVSLRHRQKLLLERYRTLPRRGEGPGPKEKASGPKP